MSSLPTSPRAAKEITAWFFAAPFLTYGYFHQGGGWNQNSRFNQVRSLAETDSLEINGYLFYAARIGSSGDIRIENLSQPAGADLRDLSAANTGDITLYGEKMYPNKASGSALCRGACLAFYFSVRERFRHRTGKLVDPDSELLFDYGLLRRNYYRARRRDLLLCFAATVRFVR